MKRLQRVRKRLNRCDPRQNVLVSRTQSIVFRTVVDVNRELSRLKTLYKTNKCDIQFFDSNRYRLIRTFLIL